MKWKGFAVFVAVTLALFIGLYAAIGHSVSTPKAVLIAVIVVAFQTLAKWDARREW